MLLARQLTEQHHCLDAAGHIQESRWLVEEDKRTLLSQCLGDHGLLPFTVAQFRHIVFCLVTNPRSFQRLSDDFVVLLLQLAEKTRVGMSAQRNQFVNRNTSGIGLFRKNHPNRKRKQPLRIIGQRFTLQMDTSGQRLLETTKRPQQRRLSRTVQSQQAGHLPGLQRKLKSLVDELLFLAFQ